MADYRPGTPERDQNAVLYGMLGARLEAPYGTDAHNLLGAPNDRDALVVAAGSLITASSADDIVVAEVLEQGKPSYYTGIVPQRETVLPGLFFTGPRRSQNLGEPYWRTAQLRELQLLTQVVEGAQPYENPTQDMVERWLNIMHSVMQRTWPRSRPRPDS